MKYTLLLCGLLLTIMSFGQWNVVYTGNQAIYDIQFVNDLVVYAVGDSTFLKSTNGGNTWTDMTPNISVTDPNFEVVHFLDANTGFIGRTDITGNPNLLKTTDGGQNWTDVSSSAMSQGVSNVFFTSANIGYATGGVGSGNSFAATNDGGQTWNAVSTPSLAASTALFFINDSVGFSGATEIRKTVDGGQNWQPVNMSALSNGNTIADILFTSASVGFALTYDGSEILKTIDSGSNWYPVVAGPSGALATAISFPTVNIGYVVGLTFTKPLITTNRGLTWNADTSFPSGLSAFSLSARNGKTLIGTLSGEILLKSNNNTGVTAVANPTVDIFPNPVTSNALGFSNPLGHILNVSVYDVLGKKVAFETGVVNEMAIQLPAAVYYCTIQVIGTNEVYSKKLVIE
ncbi:MAG: T9SS type A sorting domain-containing protein [Bacteroidetes bacterium]|nr:MAG: T9SS type A sorting domain-containing protein [Bacteroidota bacterium]